jgi:hypothetical protein
MASSSSPSFQKISSLFSSIFFHHIVAPDIIACCIIISFAHHAKYASILFLVFFCFGL